jgi:hypothetical protein
MEQGKAKLPTSDADAPGNERAALMSSFAASGLITRMPFMLKYQGRFALQRNLIDADLGFEKNAIFK